jgi:hypothetical protein
MTANDKNKLITLHKKITVKLNIAIKNKQNLIVQNNFERQILKIQQKINEM